MPLIDTIVQDKPTVMAVSNSNNSATLSISKATQPSGARGSTDVEPTQRAKIETFELSEKAHPYIPVSTTKILSNYTRDPPPEISDVLLQERRLSARVHAETVDRLRRWAGHGEGSVAGKILRAVGIPGARAKMPPSKDVFRSIDHFFPPRSDIRVVVCDFGDGKAMRQEVRLGDIQQGK